MAIRPPFSSRLRDQTGSAMALTIMALLTVGILFYVGQMLILNKADLFHLQGSNGTQSRARQAIEAYAAQNGILPCPAQNSAGARGAACAAGTPLWGPLPWKDLGLQPTDAVDSYGRMLTYVADGATNLCSTSGGVNNTSLLTFSGDTTSQGLYALISHGKNGYNGILPGGGQPGLTPASDRQMPASPSASENQNCPSGATQVAGLACAGQSGATTVKTGPYSASATAPFDDVVDPSAGLEFTCLCEEPTITMSGVGVGGGSGAYTLTAPTSGSVVVTVTAAMPTASGCVTPSALMSVDSTSSMTAGASGLGTYSTTLAAPYTAGSYSFTINGASNSGSSAATSTLIIDAGNSATSGWPSGRAPVAKATLTVTYPPQGGSGSGGSGGSGGGPASGAASQTTTTARANNNQQISLSATTTVSAAPTLLPPPSGLYATGSSLIGADQTSYNAATYQPNFANYTLYASPNSSQDQAYFDFSQITGSSGTLCFSTTPGGSGPYIDSSQITVANSSWQWSSLYVNTLPNHAIDFMGSNSGSGCAAMSGTVQFSIPTVYKGFQAAVYFDPSTTRPAALGFTFKNNGTTQGTVYVCYANSNASANTLFPTITQWGSTANWCTTDSHTSTLSTNNPQYLYFYDYTGGFTEVDVFSVTPSTFWIGGVGLVLN